MNICGHLFLKFVVARKLLPVMSRPKGMFVSLSLAVLYAKRSPHQCALVTRYSKVFVWFTDSHATRCHAQEATSVYDPASWAKASLFVYI